MTKIKICGLTTPLEAEWVSKSQVDYAGMVLFFPKIKIKNGLYVDSYWVIALVGVILMLITGQTDISAL